MNPITIHEHQTIIRQLALRGKWQTQRNGAHVDMALLGKWIHYSVTIARHKVISARAGSVLEAVADINRIILSRPPEDLAGRAVRDPARTGTPQLLRHRPCSPISGMLPLEDA